MGKLKNYLSFFYQKLKYINEVKKIKFKEKNIILINTPEHGNLGDQMIAYASLKYLEKNYKDKNIIEITHNAFLHGKNVLKDKIKKDDLILITGGGYLGDLWINEQKLVNEILDIYASNNIIFLSQTIFFNDLSKYDSCLKRIRKKENVHMFVREKNSYDLVTKDGYISKEKLTLIPDMVLTYPIIEYKYKRNGTALCLRSDKEKSCNFEGLEGIVKDYYGEDIEYIDTVVNRRVLVENREKELFDFFELLSKKELVITDRLHGMIFCYLTKTPCIVFDNISKKVSGVYQWLKESDNIYYIENYSKDSLAKGIQYFKSKKEFKKIDLHLENQFFNLKKIIDENL